MLYAAATNGHACWAVNFRFSAVKTPAESSPKAYKSTKNSSIGKSNLFSSRRVLAVKMSLLNLSGVVLSVRLIFCMAIGSASGL